MPKYPREEEEEEDRKKQEENEDEGRDIMRWPRCRGLLDANTVQTNGCDCGVYVIAIAEFLSKRLPLGFTRGHMDDFRYGLAYEVMQHATLATASHEEGSGGSSDDHRSESAPGEVVWL